MTPGSAAPPAPAVLLCSLSSTRCNPSAASPAPAVTPLQPLKNLLSPSTEAHLLSLSLSLCLSRLSSNADLLLPRLSSNADLLLPRPGPLMLTFCCLVLVL